MNLKNQPPVFVPDQYQKEIERLSKAALMDMVWDLGTRCSGGDDLAHFKVMDEIRSTRDIILNYRKQELPSHRKREREAWAAIKTADRREEP